MSRPSWPTYWLGVAAAVAARADCSRRQVGAVVVSPDNRLRGAGYNGAPPGDPGCLTGACPRATSAVATDSSYDTGPGACIAIHAEANALIDAGRQNCLGATLYITHRPCDGCRKLIRAAGIVRTIYPPGDTKCSP